MDEAFELFDHTADIGVSVRAAEPVGAVRAAAAGLYATIGRLTADRHGEPISMEFTGGSPEELLRDFLAELLFLFETEQMLVVDISEAHFGEDRLVVTGVRRPLDVEASELAREVKAVTYHELSFGRSGDGWEATFIVDI